MKKLAFLIVFLLIFGNGVSVFAVTQSQVNQESAQVENLKTEITRLDNQINNYEIQINSLNAQIESTSQQLLQAQQEEQKLVTESEDRMKAAYMYGDTGYLEYLFSAESPSDFISYFDITRDIVTDDKSRVDEIKQKKLQIQTLQNQLTTTRAQTLALKQQSETLRAQKERTLTQNQQTLALLQQQLNQQQLDAQNSEAGETPKATVPAEVANNITRVSNANPEPTVSSADTSSAAPAEESAENTETKENTESSEPAQSTETTDDSAEKTISIQSTTTTDKPDAAVSATQYLPAYVQELLGISTPGGQSTGSFPMFSDVNSVASGNWVWPLDVTDPNAFTITSSMGFRDSPGGVGSTDHHGTDIGASYGTAILAADAGTVTIAGTYGGYGNCVQIDHGNGYITIYGHMSSIAVEAGETVSAGQVIGFVGSTGWSTGPHLHFEVRYQENGNETIVDATSLYDASILSRLTYSE